MKSQASFAPCFETSGVASGVTYSEEFRVQGPGFRVQGLRVQGAGCRVQGAGFRV